jgi:hypothetical protein
MQYSTGPPHCGKNMSCWFLDTCFTDAQNFPGIVIPAVGVYFILSANFDEYFCKALYTMQMSNTLPEKRTYFTLIGVLLVLIGHGLPFRLASKHKENMQIKLSATYLVIGLPSSTIHSTLCDQRISLVSSSHMHTPTHLLARRVQDLRESSTLFTYSSVNAGKSAELPVYTPRPLGSPRGAADRTRLPDCITHYSGQFFLRSESQKKKNKKRKTNATLREGTINTCFSREPSGTESRRVPGEEPTSVPLNLV